MQKRVFFAVATAATMGYAIGEYDIVASDALAGQNETRTHEFRLPSIPPAIKTMVETYLTNVECPKVNAKYGDGTCNPATVPFVIRLIRSPSGAERIKGDLSGLPVFVTTRPPPIPNPDPPVEP